MSFVGSYTVIGGGNPLWGPGVICKLHYQRDTGKELGPFLHFDGNSLKANGGDTDNGEKKKYGVRKIARQRYHTLSFGLREYSRKNFYKRG